MAVTGPETLKEPRRASAVAARLLASWGTRRDVKLHDFNGGLMLAGDKQAAEQAIVDIPLPATLVLPLVNYRRELLTSWVRPGDQVAGGTAVAAGVLAGTSGTVVSIEERPFIHPSGLSAPCVVIETDQRDDLASLPPLTSLTLERLLEAGIQGMGGAGFAAADKLRAIAAGRISLLIINAAECEPGIACDAGLMQAEAESVIRGVHQLVQLTQCHSCIIAIERTSVTAHSRLQAALLENPLHDVTLVSIPPRYPSGAETTLVHLLSGVRLRAGERPTDHGMLCLNVATAAACGEAVRGTPLHSRLMTVGGDRVAEPRNVRVRFGTPLSHVLRCLGLEHELENLSHVLRCLGLEDELENLSHVLRCQGLEDELTNDKAFTELRAGGPLSGFRLTSAEAPVVATTNCVMLNRLANTVEAHECIRCGHCADVCPADLLPQQLYRYARSGNAVQLKRFSLSACITCGCCDLVCPSGIPLTGTFRHAQSRLREQDHQEREAVRLAGLHAGREQRLQRKAAEQEAEKARRRLQLETREDPVAAALARAKARRRGPAAPVPISTPVPQPGSDGQTCAGADAGAEDAGAEAGAGSANEPDR